MNSVLSIDPRFTRREALRLMGAGFGAVGMAAARSPLAPKQPPFAAKAKRVICLMLNGGLSHVDSFDPKPALSRFDGKPYPGGNPKTERATGNLMRSPFTFQKYGQSGIEISEIYADLARSADDLCVIRSMHTEVPNHEPSLFMMNCGAIQPGRPSMGSWITYGLGTENQNLPGFVVLCPGVPVVGPPLWDSAFLPAVYQGSHIRNNETDPKKLIQYIEAKGTDPARQRKQLDLLKKLNERHQAERGGDPQLEAAIESMEIAYRMQTEAPEVFDLTKESEATRKEYGEGDFARACLMSRRLVERGVRVVQVYFGASQPFDNHEDILALKGLSRLSDRPMGALLRDLKQRGLLAETLVLIGTEFGRTPAVETSGSTRLHAGRDHNSYGFSVVLAGGGIKGGTVYGATDEFGFRAEEKPVHPHDLHATMLHLLGFDHTQLTYPFSGRDFRLTDVHGNVIREILA